MFTAVLGFSITGLNYIVFIVGIPAILSSLPRHTLELISANLLGDGSIRFTNLARDGKISGNARYEMTMSSKVVDYIQHLFETIYGQFSKTGLKGWPNTYLAKHAGKVVSQYFFSTQSLPIFTSLHLL